MNGWIKELNVGDKVLVVGYGASSYIAIRQVERIGKAYITVDGRKFYIKTGRTSNTEYSGVALKPYTPGCPEEIEIRTSNAIRRIKSYLSDNPSLLTLQKMLEVIQKDSEVEK